MDVSSPRHLPALDGLRGIAILLVLVAHANSRAGGARPGDTLSIVLGAGWVGVDLFFVLSGFLITRGLIDGRGRPRYYRNFFARRALRIMPLYFAFLGGSALLLPGLGPLSGSAPEREYAPWLATYAYNLRTAYTECPSAGFHHFWSLGVEEHFYVFWPVAVALCPPRRLPRLIAFGAGLSFALRLGVACGGYWLQVAYLVTPCRLDGLLAGALAAIAVRDRPEAVRRLALPVGALAALVLATIAGHQGHFLDFIDHARDDEGFARDSAPTLTVGLAALAVLFAAGVARAAVSERAGLFDARWLRAVGKYSYGMYVFHALVLTVGILSIYSSRLGVPAARLSESMVRLTLFAFAVVGSYLLAWISYHAFERHFLRLKRRFGRGE